MVPRFPSPPWGRSIPRRVGIVLLLGLAIREAFSFWTGHPYDFEVWIRTGYVVANGQNPYNSFWPPVPGVSIAFTQGSLPSAAYLPFWSGYLGLTYRGWELAGGGNRFLLYFLFKQPPIAGDLLASFLIYRIVGRWSGDPKAAFTAMTVWTFFPYDIMVSAIWGQFDSLIVVLLLALLHLREPVERNVVLGVGIFVKWLTAIFLPLEFFRARGIRRLIPLLGVLVPVVLTVMTFEIAGWGFTGIQATSSGESSGGGGGMNAARFLSDPRVTSVLGALPGLYAVLPYLWVPGVILGGWAAAKWLGPEDHRAELRAMLFLTTVFLLLRWGLNEQYMLYLFSLMIVDLYAFHPGRRLMLAVTAVTTFTFLLVNNNLGIWFLAPVSSGYWTYATQVDASAGVGVFRTDVLFVLAAIVTAVLLQLAYAFYRDQPAPFPWLIPRRGLVRGSGPTP